MEESGAARCRIVAVLGPTISGPAYEVGSDLMTRFIDADPANERFFTANGRPSHAQFDLPAYIGARLSACGIGEVAALGRCTYTEEEHFFSFRRTTHRGEADYGRLISAITLTVDADDVRRLQARCWPPSTAIIWPVMLGERARNRTASAISAGVGPRFSRTAALCLAKSSSPWRVLVSVGPGPTAFTRMRGASAGQRVAAKRAAFVSV